MAEVILAIMGLALAVLLVLPKLSRRLPSEWAMFRKWCRKLSSTLFSFSLGFMIAFYKEYLPDWLLLIFIILCFFGGVFALFEKTIDVVDYYNSKKLD
ncbi:hypothetical protein [Alteraurantiacibacter palmitatis]|uniref:DUF3325 domain-containing protein n=1 Tax=Alteraurantiacibacter palmitatis TaxID=2054628 RepID=A0ABV7E934_9SPHN